jgi:hypothetical protein
MWLAKFRLTRVIRNFFRGGRSAPSQPRKRIRLNLEHLEDRCLPAILQPTTLLDGIGIGSLRDAIVQANSNGQNNTIILSAGTYQLSVAGRNETASLTGDLDLTAAGFTEIIRGAGAGVTVIDANSIDRAFQVIGNVHVIFKQLSIEGGLATDSGSVGLTASLGGGILNNGGTVTLNHVRVIGNEAHGNPGQAAQGGGIYSNGLSLTITDSSLLGNQAIGGEGSEGSNGADGTVGGDGAPGGAGGDGQGGGLYLAGGSLTVLRSTIASNLAKGGLGGLGGNGGNTSGPPPTTAPPPPPTTGGPPPTFPTSPTVPTSGFGPPPTGGGPPPTTAGPPPTFSTVPTGGGGPIPTGGGPVPTGGGPVPTGGGPVPTGGGPAPTGGGPAPTGGGAPPTGGGTAGMAPLARVAAMPLAAGGIGGGDGGAGGLGGRGQGGGLYLAGGLVSLTNSTIAWNTADGGGGGGGGNPGTGMPDGTGGNGGDAGASQGGGLINGATVTLTNCTFAADLATNSLGGLVGAPGAGTPVNGNDSSGEGGGAFNAPVGTLHAVNTLFGNDTATVAPDFSGNFASAQNNFLGIGDGSSLSPANPDANGNIVGSAPAPIDPLLGTFGNNGGPTDTMALMAGSPAVDAGTDSVVQAPLNLTTDQRGLARLVGLHVDIGAYEQDTPVAYDQSLTALEGGMLNLTLTAKDADGQPLSYIIVNGPTNGTLTGSGPNLTYTPAAGYTGPDAFTFKASNGSFDSNVATISITVKAAITDDFNRANSPSLGTDWQITPLPDKLRFTYRHREGMGGFALQGGQAVSASTSVATEQVAGLSLQDSTIQADVDVSGSQSVAAGLMARIQSNGDAYVAVLTHSGTAEIWLFHASDNTFKVLDSEPAPVGVNTLQFVVNASSLTLYVNGSLTASATDSTLNAPGGVGIFAWGPGGIIDNFSVTAS